MSEQDEERSRRAPTGLASTMHGFWIGLFTLILIAGALAELTDGQLGKHGSVFLVAAGVDALYFAVVFAWIHLWRRTLRFRLTGYDVINGHSPERRGRVPFIAFRVRVITNGAEPEAKKAARHALALLVGRANALLEGEEEVDAEPSQRWRLKDDLEACGESWKAIYITGVFRDWLRGEMNEAATAHAAIREVVFEARYTGGSYGTSISHMS